MCKEVEQGLKSLSSINTSARLLGFFFHYLVYKSSMTYKKGRVEGRVHQTVVYITYFMRKQKWEFFVR